MEKSYWEEGSPDDAYFVGEGVETSTWVEERKNKEVDGDKEDAKDKSNAIFDEMLQDIFSPSHNIAWDESYKDRLDMICGVYSSLCNKVTLDGSFDAQERFFYTSIPVFLIARFDRYSNEQGDIAQALKSINIYKDLWRRGYATSSSIQINLWSMRSMREYLEIVSHELFHVIDLWVIWWSSSQLHPLFTEFGRPINAIDDPSLKYYALGWDSEKIRKASVGKEWYCSAYGQTDPYEDVAECWNLYRTHNALFRYYANKNTIMAHKYNYRAQFFDGKYLFKSKNDLFLVQNNPHAFFFDTTRIYSQ